VRLIKSRKNTNVLFILFILSVGWQKSDYLISVYTGIRLQDKLGFSLLVFPLIFLILAKIHSKINFSIFKEVIINPFPALISTYIIWLFFYGVIRQNNFIVILWELYPAVIIILCYKLGRANEIWRVFSKYWIFFILTILVALGTIIIREDILLVGLESKVESVTTATVAYEISPILDIWPMVFLLGFFNDKSRSRILPFIPALIYVLFQFYFIKRAPTIRAFSYILCGFVILAYFNNRVKNKSIIPRLIGVMLITMVLYFLIPFNLMEKFDQKDVARQEESLAAIKSFTPLEHLFGRGLGGWYAYSEGAGIVENFYGPNKVSGKDITHIGITYPYLKGGLILFFLIFFHIVNVVLYGLRNISKMTYIELSCLSFLIVYSLFRLVEGPVSTGAIFDGTLFGLTLGRLEYYKRNLKLGLDMYNPMLEDKLVIT